MFTGIIEGVGRIAALQPVGGDLRLTVAVGSLPFDAVQLGESIAVNGVCLTVISFDASSFQADASTETLSLTTLGRLRDGAVVNLERAMRPTDRLGGHLVSGHVDGVGRVLSVHGDARAQRWRFAAPAPLLKYIAKKGSICVDGVSLTVNEVDGEGFEVALIPHTVSHTAFSQTAVGDAAHALDDAGEHQQASGRKTGKALGIVEGMARLSRKQSGDAPGARRQAHDAALARGSAMPSSFIRTMTVGSGIGPNLLTSRRGRERSRARGHPEGRDTYRRWGIAPRPEDVCWFAGGLAAQF